MPITQDRMIGLIEIGQDAERSSKAILTITRNERKRLAALSHDLLEADPKACAFKLIELIETAFNMIEENAAMSPESRIALAIEAEHFRLTQKQNNRAASRQRLKRAGGIRTRSEREAYEAWNRGELSLDKLEGSEGEAEKPPDRDVSIKGADARADAIASTTTPPTPKPKQIQPSEAYPSSPALPPEGGDVL